MRATSTLALLVATSFLAVTARAAIDPAARCTQTRLKAAAAKVNSELKCHAAAAAKAIPVDQSCIDKAEAKFSAVWAKALTRGGCPDFPDETAVVNQINACVNNVTTRFRACGDVNGVCGGACPVGMNCFAIGVGCFGELEPCRCHSSTTTCPSTTSTSSSTTSTTVP